LPELDQAAISLSDVIDSMLTTSALKRESVEVHVRAMRLLFNPHAPGVDAAAILNGLRKVRSRSVGQTSEARSRWDLCSLDPFA